MSLQPSRGARILFERAGHPPTEPHASRSARYRASILLPEARFDFTVDFAADGTPTIEAVVPVSGTGASQPSPRASEVLRSIARTMGRHAVAEDPPAWPRRVLRWRKLD